MIDYNLPEKGIRRLADLPRDYLTGKGNIKLLSMGKIYQFGEGCACPIDALSSKFLEILDFGDGEFLIADTDAGIEHFGRGVEKGVDILFAVIDPSRESILLAEKVSELGIGTAANIHFAASTPGLVDTFGCSFDGPLQIFGGTTTLGLQDDIVVNTPVLRDGAYEVPTGPGLGVELNEANIDKYRNGEPAEVSI